MAVQPVRMSLLVPMLFIAFGDASGAEPAPVVVAVERDEVMDRLFANKEGWIGGDGADSVEIAEGRTAWLFSDTWIGKIRDGKRQGEGIVNNTVAIQNGWGEDAKIEFPVRRDAKGKPAAFITPDDGRGFFWMRAATMHDGRLFMFLSQDELTPKGGAFGFREIGAWVAIVSNPEAPPLDWRISQKRIPFATFSKTEQFPWGSAAVEHDGQLYVYGLRIERPGLGQTRDLIVARAPIDAIDDFEQWRFFSEGGEWKSTPDDFARLVPEMSNEATVTYLPGLKEFVLIYSKGGYLPQILARTAKSPEGPWSEAAEVFECPESDPARGVFAYEAKGRVTPAADDELLISYLTNAMDFGTVANDAELYYPKFIRAKFERKAEGKRQKAE